MIESAGDTIIPVAGVPSDLLQRACREHAGQLSFEERSQVESAVKSLLTDYYNPVADSSNCILAV